MSQAVTQPTRPGGRFRFFRDLWTALTDPMAPTREALKDIAHILEEAGWADPDPGPADDLGRLRAAAGEHLRPDDLPLVQAVITDIRPLPEVAAALGRDPADLERAVAD
ncbi:MAG: hypothetical protein K2X87_24865, partial [Gemmataceae bacterium]|nr:hypothetical protein [Gemmataceae bacterium]